MSQNRSFRAWAAAGLAVFVVACFAGQAGAATTITWVNALPAGNYDWFNTANWTGGDQIPDAEGESVQFTWASKMGTVDLKCVAVDLYGTGVDPGNISFGSASITGGVTFKDTVGGASIKCNQFLVGAPTTYAETNISEVPITAVSMVDVHYPRGRLHFQQHADHAPSQGRRGPCGPQRGLEHYHG